MQRRTSKDTSGYFALNDLNDFIILRAFVHTSIDSTEPATDKMPKMVNGKLLFACLLNFSFFPSYFLFYSFFCFSLFFFSSISFLLASFLLFLSLSFFTFLAKTIIRILILSLLPDLDKAVPEHMTQRVNGTKIW